MQEIVDPNQESSEEKFLEDSNAPVLGSSEFSSMWEKESSFPKHTTQVSEDTKGSHTEAQLQMAILYLGLIKRSHHEKQLHCSAQSC